MQVKDLIEYLQQNYKPEDHVAYSLWSVNDIVDYAEERDIKCSETQAKSILSKVNDKHDANIGINWDVINEHIDSICH